MTKTAIKKSVRAALIATVLILVCALSACTQMQKKTFSTLADLENCRFAISDTNSSYETQIMNDIPGVTFDRYTNYFDTFIAVTNGNADTAFCFKYTFIGLKESYPDLQYIESDYKIPIVANFSAEANELRKDFNAFIAESRQNGLLDGLAQKWLYDYDSLKDDEYIDFSDLNGTKGTVKLGISNDNIPYEYLRSGKLTGFEPALFYEFCKARGYRPLIEETAYSAVLAGVAAGKYDMGFGGYGFTEERDENSHFSDPIFYDQIVYTVLGDSSSPSDFLTDIKNSFEKTFIRQDRWQLFVGGMLVTLLVTVLSVLLGSLAGFLLFLLSYKFKWLTSLSYKINDTLEALPILVVLMVFFYIIFGKSSISGVAVSIIVFGLCFTFTFFAMICNSVRGVPGDQTEAGLALGYNNRQTLFKIVLPQAMESFIPSIRSAIVATLKSTAVIGYVAVQDLTKAGDLVRSQTFEAFMPIITVALLYFALAKLLIFLLNKLLITPSERRKMKREGK